MADAAELSAADIRKVMSRNARLRWARATEAEKLEQGRLMTAGRRKARRLRRASERKAKRA
jgi:hypothetical protein